MSLSREEIAKCLLSAYDAGSQWSDTLGGHRRSELLAMAETVTILLAEAEAKGRAEALKEAKLIVHSTVDIELADYDLLIERLDALAAQKPERKP